MKNEADCCSLFFETGEWYVCPRFTLHTLHLFALFSKNRDIEKEEKGASN